MMQEKDKEISELKDLVGQLQRDQYTMQDVQQQILAGLPDAPLPSAGSLPSPCHGIVGATEANVNVGAVISGGSLGGFRGGRRASPSPDRYVGGLQNNRTARSSERFDFQGRKSLPKSFGVRNFRSNSLLDRNQHFQVSTSCDVTHTQMTVGATHQQHQGLAHDVQNSYMTPDPQLVPASMFGTSPTSPRRGPGSTPGSMHVSSCTVTQTPVTPRLATTNSVPMLSGNSSARRSTPWLVRQPNYGHSPKHCSPGGGPRVANPSWKVPL